MVIQKILCQWFPILYFRQFVSSAWVIDSINACGIGSRKAGFWISICLGESFIVNLEILV
ncbi:hypothetical protein M758_1G243100 [Ceratodon purpureus]|nr:hypothetical protein M758_1G243100 [Ceratodon purpureus]